MKKFLFAGVALSALAVSPVFAADMAARPVYKAAPVAAIYNWTGCYIGGHVGGATAKRGLVNTVDTSTWGDLTPGQGYSVRSSGVIGGGHLGCNYQTGPVVFGVEGTFAGTSISNSFTNSAFPATGLVDR